MPASLLILNNHILSNAKKTSPSPCHIIIASTDSICFYACSSTAVIDQFTALLICCIIAIGTVFRYNKQLNYPAVFPVIENIRDRSIRIDLSGRILIYCTFYGNADFYCAVRVIGNFITACRCFFCWNLRLIFYRRFIFSSASHRGLFASHRLIAYICFIYAYFTRLVYRILINLGELSSLCVLIVNRVITAGIPFKPVHGQAPACEIICNNALSHRPLSRL